MAAPGPQRQVAPSFFSNTWQIAGCALDNMAGPHPRRSRINWAWASGVWSLGSDTGVVNEIAAPRTVH
jgi:hypothetical protein